MAFDPTQFNSTQFLASLYVLQGEDERFAFMAIQLDLMTGHSAGLQ